LILQAGHRAETPETKTLEIVAKRQFGGCFGKKSEQTSVVCGFHEHFLAAEKAPGLDFPVLH
jgi:hypothetical protein